MAYTKNTWEDQNVERPRTYAVQNNQDSTITLTDSFGVVTTLGTPVNATNMNHIEDGIESCDTAITTLDGVVVKKTGTQTVTGAKTFSGTIMLSGTAKATNQGGLSTPTNPDNGNIVTTVDYDRGSNGFIRLGNGLIVQWGQNTASNYTKEVSLPKAFTNGDTYHVVVCDFGSGSDIQGKKVTSQTASKFTVRAAYSGSDSFNWVAIGY